jgi:hypothetical protein
VGLQLRRDRNWLHGNLRRVGPDCGGRNTRRLQVVSAELVDHHDDNQLRLADLGLGRSRKGKKKSQQNSREEGEKRFGMKATQGHDCMINNEPLRCVSIQ